MKEIHNPKGKTVVMGLDVVDLAEIPSRAVPKHNRQHRDRLERTMAGETDHENKVWRGGIRNMGEAAAVLADGWQDGADRAMALARDLEPHLPDPISRRRMRRFADDGDDLDPDRYLSGACDQMWVDKQRAIQVGVGTVIDIAASWGGNGGLSADQLFWTGAAMVVLCDILENAGYSCALNLIDVVRWVEDWEANKCRYQATIVRVKEAGEPLRADAVAAVSAHPGIYRSLAFAVTELAPWDVGHGHGQAAELDDVLPALIADRQIEPAKIVIPKLQSREAALAFLVRALQDIDAAQYAAVEQE